MPYNDRLAERIHRILADKEGFTERRMFGGIAFMLNGNMCCGVINDYLILRLGSEEAQRALREPHAKEFDLTGRPTKGIILVTPSGYASEDSLRRWLRRAADFTSSLQPKGSKNPKPRRRP